MGLNVDLHKMIGLPLRATCPQCGERVDTRATDYDIECGNPNPTTGVWEIDHYCDHCDAAWTVTYTVQLTFKRTRVTNRGSQ